MRLLRLIGHPTTHLYLTIVIAIRYHKDIHNIKLHMALINT